MKKSAKQNKTLDNLQAPMTMSTIAKLDRIIVTGAAGNLGRKICQHLAVSGWNIDPIVIEPADHVFRADLASYTEDWVDRFKGASAVIHLAGAAWPYNDWSSLQSGNIDALMNVLEASVVGGVPRFIFASSLLTMDGYKNTAGIIRPNMPATPRSHYADCKLVGERLCHNFWTRHGLDVGCLRLGITRRGANEPNVRVGLWEQSRWLANSDVCRALELSLRKPAGRGYYVVFVVSKNRGMRWSLEEAAAELGYAPQEESVPSAPALIHRLMSKWRRDFCRK
jgi:nucleoside-diphosphate-sugar epimerase